MPKGLIPGFYGFLVLCCAGCGSDKKSTSPGTDEVSKYLAELPAWSEFSPLRAETDPIPAGDPVVSADTVDVTRYAEDGNTEQIPDVRYTCTETEYSITKNPTKFVMCGGPNIDMLWPGALVQGRSLRDLGSLLPLTIQERTQIKVSIPALATVQNYREVVPSQAGVASAIGEMIGDATVSELATPSSISFEMRQCCSEEEFALNCGMSARYLGFRASAQGGYSQSVAKTTITVQFYQRMYEVVVEPPQTPVAFFSDEFTVEKLQEQVALERIGPENLPVYVSKVVYGRMLMFTMTSTATQEEIQATVQAAYSGIGGGGSANLSAKHRAILANAEFEIASLGGSAQDVLNIIRSGDWSQYFTADPPLSTAEPLSYEFRNLGDGSIALVSETTHYTKKVCAAVSSSTSFGSAAPIDSDADGIADRFCPQRTGGDCDYNGNPMVVLSINYAIDDTGVRAILYMKAWRWSSVGESQWYINLLRIPSGTSITRIGGMAPEEWRAANAGQYTNWGGTGLSGDIVVGSAIVRIIGDTNGCDLCGECNQDQQGCSGIWSIIIPETQVDLDLGCCP
jgi:hypothetical protein